MHVPLWMTHYRVAIGVDENVLEIRNSASAVVPISDLRTVENMNAPRVVSKNIFHTERAPTHGVKLFETSKTLGVHIIHQ